MSRRFTPSLAPVGRLISAQPVGLEQTGASGFPEFIFARGAFNLDTQPSERIYIYIYMYILIFRLSRNQQVIRMPYDVSTWVKFLVDA